MSSTPEQIIREFHEAGFALKQKMAQVASRDEFVSLPSDVREARVALECAEESKRAHEAAIALDTMRQERDERWVAAHEELIPWRSQVKQ